MLEIMKKTPKVYKLYLEEFNKKHKTTIIEGFEIKEDINLNPFADMEISSSLSAIIDFLDEHNTIVIINPYYSENHKLVWIYDILGKSLKEKQFNTRNECTRGAIEEALTILENTL